MIILRLRKNNSFTPEEGVDGMFGENVSLFYIFTSGEHVDLIIMANSNLLLRKLKYSLSHSYISLLFTYPVTVPVFIFNWYSGGWSPIGSTRHCGHQ
jgi:hypothetical protein